MTSEPSLYLASQSPRRRELLHQIGVEFDVLLMRNAPPRGPDISEVVWENEAPKDYVERVTREKVEFAWKILGMRQLPLRPILAADTTVTLNGLILGKPADFAEAQDMMQALSGQTHEVITSIALCDQGKIMQATHISAVTFSSLTPDMIAAYCQTGEPYDKAGGYGIQGLAATFIAHISGSYSSIMGLPLFETTQLLRKVGVPIL